MKRLQSDDLHVGMLVTVAQPKPWDRVVTNGFTATLVQSEDRSYMGDVMRITAIDLPFVVVVKIVTKSGSVPKPGDYDSRPFSINTSEYVLSSVADEYAVALGAQPTPPPTPKEAK